MCISHQALTPQAFVLASLTPHVYLGHASHNVKAPAQSGHKAQPNPTIPDRTLPLHAHLLPSYAASPIPWLLSLAASQRTSQTARSRSSNRDAILTSPHPAPSTADGSACSLPRTKKREESQGDRCRWLQNSGRTSHAPIRITARLPAAAYTCSYISHRAMSPATSLLRQPTFPVEACLLLPVPLLGYVSGQGLVPWWLGTLSSLRRTPGAVALAPHVSSLGKEDSEWRVVAMVPEPHVDAAVGLWLLLFMRIHASSPVRFTKSTVNIDAIGSVQNWCIIVVEI
jgi:hypothetical protein